MASVHFNELKYGQYIICFAAVSCLDSSAEFI